VVETTLRYSIAPVAKPRMTQRDKWQQRRCVMRYRAFKDECWRLGVYLPEAGARVTFWIPMPKSWTKRKRAEMEGMPHQQKPDLDNLIKALADACYKDDSAIWQITAEKRWASKGEVWVDLLQR